MPISFACRGCGKRYNVNDSMAGRTVKCKACGAAVRIPEAEADEIIDLYDMDEEATLPHEGGGGGAPIPRGASRSPTSGGIPPWAWLAVGGTGGAIVAGVLALALASRSGGRPAANEAPALVAAEAATGVAAVPSGSSAKDEARASSPAKAPVDPNAWRVVADPAPVPLAFPEVPQLSIPVPAYFGSDYIVYPTTPSPFVMLGDTANEEHVREVWDLRSASLIGRLQGKVDVFKPKALSPDGASFVTHTLFAPRSFDVWEIGSGNRIARIPDDGKHLYEIADFVGPGTGKVVFGSPLSKLFEVWDYRAGRKLLQFTTPANFESESVAFSPGRRYLALTLQGKNKLLVYDLMDGRQVGEHAFPKEGNRDWDCKALAFSPDGAALAGLFEVGNTARLLAWDFRTGRLVSSFRAEKNDGYGKPHANANLPLQWLPDGSGWLLFDANIVDRQSGRIAWTLPFPPIKYNEHGPRRILDLGRVVALAEVNGRQVLQMSAMPREKIAAALSIAGSGGSLVEAMLPAPRAADLAGARSVAPTAGTVDWKAVATPSAGGRSTSGTRSAAARPIPLDVPAGDVLSLVVSGPEADQALVVSTPGGRLADQGVKQGAPSRRVDRIDLAGGRRTGRFEIPSVSTPVAIGPKGTRFLLFHAGAPDRLDVHEADNGRHLAGWRPFGNEKGDDRNLAWAEFLDDGRVLTVNRVGTLILWSIPDPRAVYVAKQAMEGVPILSPDRKVLATVHHGILRLIDPTTGAPTADAVPTGHDTARGLEVASFAPDGRELAALIGGTIVRWDLATGKVAGECPSPVPEARSLHFGAGRHVLLDGRTLLDLESRRVVGTYNGGVHPQGGSGARHRFVAAEGIIDKGTLRTIEIPEVKVASAEAALADPKVPAMLRDGAKVSIQIVGNPDRDADRWREDFTRALTDQIQAIGAEVAANQRVRIVVRFRVLETGRSYRIRDVRKGFERTGPIRHLEWELSVADDKGPPIVIAQGKIGLLGPGFFEHIPPGENDWDGYLRARQWSAGAEEVATHGIPYYVARRSGGSVFLPASTFLGYPAPVGPIRSPGSAPGSWSH